MFEYTFNKTDILFLELIDPLLQDINLQPYTLEYTGNVLRFVYTDELTNEQYTTLSDFITNYNSQLTKPPIYYTSNNIQISKNSINNVEWVLVASHSYIPITDISFLLIDLMLISNIDIGNYQVRAYNMTNNSVIGITNVLNNNIRQKNTININLPNTECIIELHAKVSDVESNCNINSAQINYYIN